MRVPLQRVELAKVHFHFCKLCNFSTTSLPSKLGQRLGIVVSTFLTWMRLFFNSFLNSFQSGSNVWMAASLHKCQFKEVEFLGPTVPRIPHCCRSWLEPHLPFNVPLFTLAFHCLFWLHFWFTLPLTLFFFFCFLLHSSVLCL